MTDPSRKRILKDGSMGSGPVLYWMSRDQRVQDNWALLASQEAALETGRPLEVCFTLADSFLEAPLRAYDFMLKGLEKVAEELNTLRIPFNFLLGDPVQNLSRLVREKDISLIVCDFDPLKIKRKWKDSLSERISIPFHEVDAHNIVPCWLASDKQEYAAYTFRPKIRRKLDHFLTDFPGMTPQRQDPPPGSEKLPLRETLDRIRCDRKAGPVKWIEPGSGAALDKLRDFIRNRLQGYSARRNDPGLNWLSDLSPYLHFGHICAQRVAMEILRSSSPSENQEAFLEELIVRKELADNFCFYNSLYDSVSGYPAWARKTLKEHRNDQRQFQYSFLELEEGRTHDPLWNAGQKEMVHRGKMHSWMRMYWAKKILEWTSCPEEAHSTALRLNDRYELDGRDPNGYTGIAWSLGGVHDRAWPDRPIFGKIRYMNFNGAKRKFNVQRYLDYSENLEQSVDL